MASPPDDKRRRIANSINTLQNSSGSSMPKKSSDVKNSANHHGNKRGRKKVGSGSVGQNGRSIIHTPNTASNGHGAHGVSSNGIKSTILASQQEKQRQLSRRKLMMRAAITILFVAALLVWSNRTDVRHDGASNDTTKAESLQFISVEEVQSDSVQRQLDSNVIVANRDDDSITNASNNNAIQRREGQKLGPLNPLRQFIRTAFVGPVTALWRKIRVLAKKTRKRESNTKRKR